MSVALTTYLVTAAVAAFATGISIAPSFAVITPEGVNIQPQGLNIQPVLVTIFPVGVNVQPQVSLLRPAIQQITMPMLLSQETHTRLSQQRQQLVLVSMPLCCSLNAVSRSL